MQHAQMTVQYLTQKMQERQQTSDILQQQLDEYMQSLQDKRQQAEQVGTLWLLTTYGLAPPHCGKLYVLSQDTDRL